MFVFCITLFCLYKMSIVCVFYVCCVAVGCTLYIHVSHSWELQLLKHSRHGEVLTFPLRKLKEAQWLLPFLCNDYVIAAISCVIQSSQSISSTCSNTALAFCFVLFFVHIVFVISSIFMIASFIVQCLVSRRHCEQTLACSFKSVTSRLLPLLTRQWNFIFWLILCKKKKCYVNTCSVINKWTLLFCIICYSVTSWKSYSIQSIIFYSRKLPIYCTAS